MGREAGLVVAFFLVGGSCVGRTNQRERQEQVTQTKLRWRRREVRLGLLLTVRAHTAVVSVVWCEHRRTSPRLVYRQRCVLVVLFHSACIFKGATADIARVE